jgi:hypothetical protein
MGKGKELEFPEGCEGVWGRRSLCDLNLIVLSAIGGTPGSPYKYFVIIIYITK